MFTSACQPGLQATWPAASKLKRPPRHRSSPAHPLLPYAPPLRQTRCSVPPSQSAALSIGLFGRFMKTERKVNVNVCCMTFVVSGGVCGMMLALLVQQLGLDAFLSKSTHLDETVT